ncbi:MAG: hypothetical protein LC632_00585 [Xanthomonadaceae bacterium]|nr:hypothetical protein [Xanthomonadaceae bacterium]
MPHKPEYASEVRTLAQKMAAGLISWAEYREARADAIHAIVNGEKPLTYEKALVFSDSTMPKEHALSQVLIDLDDVEGSARARWPAIAAISVLGIVIVIAGWAIWRSLQPPVIASAPVVQMSMAEDVLHRFITGDQWSAEAFDETITAWQAEPADAREAARRTATWRRLQQQLRERLNQQQVLSTVDESGEAAAQEQRLRNFQQALAER